MKYFNNNAIEPKKIDGEAAAVIAGLICIAAAGAVEGEDRCIM